MGFILNVNTIIICEQRTVPVINAINILKRDMAKVFEKTNEVKNKIILQNSCELETEMFTIEVSEDITLTAGDNLGFIYGILYISEKFLGIKPFWFWLDQKIDKKDKIEIQKGSYLPSKPVVKYRGWFFNDEVLIMKWNIHGDNKEPWRMAFEALLRCGGNMAIPGTDINSRKNRQLASDMGLWITHHHAEPLGAEMFVRAYPSVLPNYTENPQLFYKLWEDAVKEQSQYNVIWNLGFRGQGDCPFWSTDSSGQFDTPQKQGKLFSELIEKQRNLVRKYVKNPVFCTNLYGEIMELYDEGHIALDDEIIKVSADNGYGKMVTRRRDNHCVRISSLPKEKSEHGGIYYHVSFYDLQAANHITMLPNSVDFVNRELSEVVEKNAVDFWVINCSNVRPHVYYLDAVRKKWCGENISDITHSKEFVRKYYSNNEHIAICLENYPKAMLSYGISDDEHIGEQFYTENIRIIVHHFIKDRTKNCPQLYWLTGNIPLEEQVKMICGICELGEDKILHFYNECAKTSSLLIGGSKELFDTTIFLQAKIHYYCVKAMILFGKGYEEYTLKNYKKSFLHFGYAAEYFDKADDAMRSSEYGVWKDFYKNDCFADIKHTAYMTRKMMGIIREFGDNVRHDKWYREAVYTVEDREVFLLLVDDNHMTDQEIFDALKSSCNQ